MGTGVTATRRCDWLSHALQHCLEAADSDSPRSDPGSKLRVSSTACAPVMRIALHNLLGGLTRDTHPFKPADHKQQACLGPPHHLPELLGGGLPAPHRIPMTPVPCPHRGRTAGPPAVGPGARPGKRCSRDRRHDSTATGRLRVNTPFLMSWLSTLQVTGRLRTLFFRQAARDHALSHQ